MSDYKDILQQPLTGRMNVRSLPDQMSEGEFRFRLNMACTEEGRLCRMAGWQKFLSNGSYKNQDFHDQLLSLQTFYDDTDPVSEEVITSWPSGECSGSVQFRTQGREVPTFGMQANSPYGARRFLVGTQSRLAVLNETTGNYRLLADGLGGTTDDGLSCRIYGAQLGNNVFFTNDYDIPFYWPIDGEPEGCAVRSTREITDLDVIGVTKASVIATFAGSLHLANVVQDGQRYPNRIHSSDFNDGTSFDPARDGSIASFYDLDAGEFILAMKQLGAQLIVLTKTSIWVGSPTGVADAPFSFTIVYKSNAGDKCLAYRNTVVSTGSQLIYAGKDGFYAYDTYKAEPELVEWIDPSSGAVFNGISTFGRINQSCCDSHVAEFKPFYTQDTPDGSSKGEIWFSWAEAGSCLPSKTIVFNTEFKFVSLVDHGFSMFANYTSDTRISLRDWLLANCFCEACEEDELKFIKEPVSPAVTCPPSPAFVPASLFSDDELIRYGITTENWDAETADEDSLCALLNGQAVDDLCRDCNQAQLFVAASSTDYCLKQIGTSFNRERCTNAATGNNTTTTTSTTTAGDGCVGYTSFTGSYAADGYYSAIISRPNKLGTQEIKNIKRLILDAFPVDQVTPCVLMLRVGYSHNAYDPLTGYTENPNTSPNATSGCGIIWKTYDRKSLACPLGDDPAGLLSANLNPTAGQGFNWPVFVEGKFITWALIVASLEDSENLDSTLVPAVGGECCFTSLTIRAKPVQKAKL